MSKSKRERRKEEEKTCESREIIKKEIQKNKPITTSKILKILKDCPNFFGCLAEDQTEFTTIQSYPAFFIVNIDSSDKEGSHWISLGIYKESVEIFDTLGFKIFKWSSIPCTLLKFLHRIIGQRSLRISKRIQGSDSILCGYYCIFYVLMRPYFSWNMIQKQFSSNFEDNDRQLIKLLG